MYRLPGLPTTDLAASVAVRTLRATLLALPPGLRHGPQYQEATRRLAATARPAPPTAPPPPISPNGSARPAQA